MKKNVSFNDNNKIIYFENKNSESDILWYSDNELNTLKKNVLIEIKIIKSLSNNFYDLEKKLSSYPKINN